MEQIKELPALKLIAELMQDPDSKPFPRIIAEVLLLAARFGRFPRYYFARYLFRKDRKNIMNYYPTYYLDKIKPHFNDKEARDVLENKLYFNFFYSQFGISLPKILMYNHMNLFVLDKGCIEVDNLQDFKKLLAEAVRKSTTDHSLFIKKTFWSYGGDQVYKITEDQIERDDEVISKLYANVIRSGFLNQETVKQHPDLDRMNSSCLNTMRVDTFIGRDGKIRNMSAYLRTSIVNLHVDNISSGGCRIAIDLSTGKLADKAYQIFKANGVKLLTEHPVSGTVFRGFQIPFYAEAINMVNRAAGLMPCLRLVGWDVAVGENGPVLIEGNSDYNMAGNDLAYGGYRSHPIFREALKEIGFL
ncbi:MAG: sugar-transfer associated ATP-grasp domain-containing protein [Bacteroidales bacterium]